MQKERNRCAECGQLIDQAQPRIGLFTGGKVFYFHHQKIKECYQKFSEKDSQQIFGSPEKGGPYSLCTAEKSLLWYNKITTTMKKLSATVEESKTKSRLIGIFPFEFDDTGEEITGGASAIPDTIHLIPIGQWEHPSYGPILITASDIREFAQNFNAGVRKGVFITAGHEGYDELPAQGWISAVEVRGDGLWGTVEWNKLGQATLSDKQYKFFSPEFYRDFEDPESHVIYRNVLTGGALTKSPYFKELNAVVFSEPKLKKQFNDTMDLQALLAKKIADLSEAEQAFIKAHAAELTEEQKAEFTSIIDSAETAEEKEARETKEAADKVAADKKAEEDANVAKGLNPDGSAKEVQASEKKILMSETEVNALRKKADEGAQAFKELQAQKLSTAVTALIFTETNKAGRFLPKSKDNLRAFMETLNETQRAKFSALVGEIQQSNLFSTMGVDSKAAEGSAQGELDAKIALKQKENTKLSYSEALRQVMSENKGLESRYDAELVPVGKARGQE